MVRIQNILCPVDFFPASMQAARYAIDLARDHKAKLVFLHVINPVIPSAYEMTIDDSILESIARAAEAGLRKLAKKAQAQGVQVASVVCMGDIDVEIQSAVKSRSVDFVVMGTHGRRGFERWFMGSVSERLLRRVSVPLLTMSATKTKAGTPAIRRILIATDFSAGTPDAVAYAFAIARETQAKVIILHVLDDVSAEINVSYRDALIRSIRSELEALIPKGARDWCDVAIRIDSGLPFERIPKILEDETADLLVMTIHGKSMLERAMIGSTAERVVRTALKPVLLIPPLGASAHAKKKRRKSKKARA